MTMPSTVIGVNHDNWRLQKRRSCHMVTQAGKHSPILSTGSYTGYSPVRDHLERRLQNYGVTFDTEHPHDCPFRVVAVDGIIEHRSLHDAGKAYRLWILLLHRIFRLPSQRRAEMMYQGRRRIQDYTKRLIYGHVAKIPAHEALP